MPLLPRDRRSITAVGQLAAFFFLLVLACCCTASAQKPVPPVIHAGLDVHRSLAEAAKRLLSTYDASRNGGPSVLFALGNATESRHLISENDIRSLGSDDAFVIRSGSGWSGSTWSFVFACAGRSARATSFAFYELLQQLGFGFLHPLKPVTPKTLPEPLPVLDVLEEPRWAFRGTHYHTQHPLELTNLLNGYDAEGCDNSDKWEALLPEWESFLEWMLAQKQNYVEWMLLSDTQVARPWSCPSNEPFELSQKRKARLQILVEAAHSKGIEVGVDAPLTLQQQHCLALLPSPSGHWEQDREEVQKRVQWMLDVGVDHLGTELGSTEFTRGLSAKDLVRILSFVKKLIGPSRKLLVKNHCSTKQHADGFKDPRPGSDGAPLNFNYLSYYADPSIVAMPHTVQMYALTDPAPTYGNPDFADLRNWTKFLLSAKRPVVFYPETAYWVNYDINVPLFLAPAYANTRVRDANDIDSMGGAQPVVGQLNFESGWQWGYWLANSVQALVAWQKIPDVSQAFTRLLRFVGPNLRKPLVDLLSDFAESQRRLLIDGAQKSITPLGIGGGSVTGIAYIQGSEGLSDLGGLVARYFGLGAPQPDRLRFVDLWTDQPLLSLGISMGFSNIGADTATVPMRQQWFHTHLRPLLAEMNASFSGLAQRFDKLPVGPAHAQESLRDLFVTARLLALRCSQVLALYDHAADCGSKVNRVPSGRHVWCQERLATARGALNEALSLIPERQLQYGLSDNNTNRVAGWRAEAPNPTAYNFGYLWAVRNLFYWQRDQAIVENRIYNPCFGNINDAVQLGMHGGGGRVVHTIRNALHNLLSNKFWSIPLAECLAVSKNEPQPLGVPSRLVPSDAVHNHAGPTVIPASSVDSSARAVYL